MLGHLHASARWWFFSPALVAAVLAVGLGSLAFSLTSDRIIEPDEGLYLASAQSLRTLGEYRLTNLPTSPRQTKYPPLYPALLAGICAGAGVPVGVATLGLLKSVNAVALASVVWLAFLILRRWPAVAAVWAIVASLLVGTSAAMVSFVDIIFTELVFTALALAAMFARLATWPSSGAHRDLIAAALVALACLTRSAGIALAVGLLHQIWHERGLRGVLSPAVVCAGTPLAWFIWSGAAREAVGPLERYYVMYERPLWSAVATSPLDVSLQVGSNVLALSKYVPEVFGWPHPLMCLAGALLVLAGGRQVPAAIRIFMATSGAAYLVVVAGHPYPLNRYLVPLAPFVVMLAVAGAARLTRSELPMGRVLCVAALSLMLVVNAVWLAHYRNVVGSRVHVLLGRPAPFQWAGFQEVLHWIEGNTAENSVVAAFRESVISFYTHRRAIRATIHGPEMTRPDGRLMTMEDATAIVRAEHDRLGVNVLVVSPKLEDAEGILAERIVTRLLASRELGWTRVFTSSDGVHAIYHRHLRSTPAPDASAARQPRARSLRGPVSARVSLQPQVVESRVE